MAGPPPRSAAEAKCRCAVKLGNRERRCKSPTVRGSGRPDAGGRCACAVGAPSPSPSPSSSHHLRPRSGSATGREHAADAPCPETNIVTDVPRRVGTAPHRAGILTRAKRQGQAGGGHHPHPEQLLFSCPSGDRCTPARNVRRSGRFPFRPELQHVTDVRRINDLTSCWEYFSNIN